MSWPAALAYGLAAVLAGSFFTALAYYADSASSWAVEDRRLAGFMLVYALTLAGAAPTQIVFAMVMRLLTWPMKWNRAVHWMLLGALLGIVVPWCLARLGYLLDGMYFPAALQRLKSGLMFPLIGPMMFDVQPAWVRAMVGVATAIPLWLVVRRTASPRVRPEPGG